MNTAASRFATLALLMGALACNARPAAAQATAGSGFPPLEKWRAAVMSGDKTALKGFYLSDPRAFVQTPERKTADAANEESQFWGDVASQGLTALNPKILEQASPQPNMVSLVLRIEITFQSKGQPQQALVAASQVWVGQGQDWRILATQRSGLAPMPVIRLPQPNVPNTHLYPEPGEAQKDLANALTIAKVDHRRILAVFGANWCYDCHVLDAALRSKDLSPLVVNNYHVVHINIGDGDSNADLAARFQVPLNKGVPSLAVLDGNGQLIISQRNGEFESAAKIGMEDVRDFLTRWKPSK